MTMKYLCIFVLVVAYTSAFQGSSRSLFSAGTALHVGLPPAVEVPPVIIAPSQNPTEQQGLLNKGVSSYLERASSLSVSLQERRAPTKEEVKQKQMTFNMIFWGGGFVAPFLATFFYFGFKFWEK